MSGEYLNKLVFVLDTVPDVGGLRCLNKLPAELSDAEVAEFAFQRQRAATGVDELPSHLQQPAVYACCWRDENGFQLISAAGLDEHSLLRTLFVHLGQGVPLLRWSDRQASLSSLRWRALQAGIVTGNAWAALEACECLVKRFDSDLSAPSDLNALALLCGLPEFQALSGEALWQAALAKNWDAIRVQAELRALSCWLLQLRADFVCGKIDAERYDSEQAMLRNWLAQHGSQTLRDFSDALRV